MATIEQSVNGKATVAAGTRSGGGGGDGAADQENVQVS